jgi:hypothetical protein
VLTTSNEVDPQILRDAACGGPFTSSFDLWKNYSTSTDTADFA